MRGRDEPQVRTTPVIAVSLTEGDDATGWPKGVPVDRVDDWMQFVVGLADYFRSQGCTVKLTGFNVAMNGRSATLNVDRYAS